MNCRTMERRKWIVNNYYVEPMAHIKLLANQTKISDAGGLIEDQYYVFQAINKANGNKEVIQCGMGAARDFLRLLHHKGLPIFNPIHVEGGQHNIGNNLHNNGNVQNPMTRQLYNAVMWIITIIDALPNSTIYNIKTEIEENRGRIVPKIKAVNTIISKIFNDETLTTKIAELRANNNIRNDLCHFNLLVEEINNILDEEGKPMISYF